MNKRAIYLLSEAKNWCLRVVEACFGLWINTWLTHHELIVSECFCHIPWRPDQPHNLIPDMSHPSRSDGMDRRVTIHTYANVFMRIPSKVCTVVRLHTYASVYMYACIRRILYHTYTIRGLASLNTKPCEHLVHGKKRTLSDEQKGQVALIMMLLLRIFELLNDIYVLASKGYQRELLSNCSHRLIDSLLKTRPIR